MKSRSIEGLWLQDNQWRPFRCLHNERVQQLEVVATSVQMPRFIPAPVDLHVHGGGGADVMQGCDAIVKVLQTHAKHGTGALLATCVTAPLDEIDSFVDDVATVMQQQPDNAALLLGAHLEGPFINPAKLGAQPAHAVTVDGLRLERWLASGVVRIITYAPEQDPQGVVPELCSRYNVKMQVGHTACHWSQALLAFQAGAGVTHLYNAMSAVSHRDGGAATAALAYADYAEIITDGIHVDKAAFELAYRSIPHLYSVTDATAASGMPDGHYRLGSIAIEKKHGRVFLPDGTLAGSCLTQCGSLSVLENWGLGWFQISQLCSVYPAQWLGNTDLGCIQVGAMANWLELRESRPEALWICGKRFALQE